MGIKFRYVLLVVLGFIFGSFLFVLLMVHNNEAFGNVKKYRLLNVKNSPGSFDKQVQSEVMMQIDPHTDSNPTNIMDYLRQSENKHGDIFGPSNQEKEKLRKGSTPVYIVEEHHEVTPYWFLAAKEGRVPTHGNVLIHIDGHSDFVVPSFPKNASIFSHPKKVSDLKNRMQSNDAFIMSSAYSGLFSRIIWIFPSWDKDRLNDNGDFESSIRAFGHVRGMTHMDDDSLCVCYLTLYPKSYTQCEYVGESDERNDTIKDTDCDVKQIVLTEVVSDAHATTLLKNTDWITSTDNIIYDIDEDYYGCEFAIQPLLDVGINESYIDDKLVPVLESMFCPSTASEELGFDLAHYKLLNTIYHITTQFVNSKDVTDIAMETFNYLSNKNLTHALCEKISFQDTMKNYIAVIFNLRQHQIKALAEVGICLYASPATSNFNKYEGMKLCDGYNRPGSKYVYFYSPTVSELDDRTRQLKTIFKNLPAPQVVTVCRSGRDGYVPRKHAISIETDILDLLKNEFSGISDTSFQYDSNLLGGNEGWYNRHKNIIW